MSTELVDSVWMLNQYIDTLKAIENPKKIKCGSGNIKADSLVGLIEMISSKCSDLSYTEFSVDITYFRDETEDEMNERIEYEKNFFTTLRDSYKGSVKNNFNEICNLIEKIDLNLDQSPDVYTDLNERQYELYQSLKQKYEGKE